MRDRRWRLIGTSRFERAPSPSVLARRFATANGTSVKPIPARLGPNNLRSHRSRSVLAGKQFSVASDGFSIRPQRRLHVHRATRVHVKLESSSRSKPPLQASRFFSKAPPLPPQIRERLSARIRHPAGHVHRHIFLFQSTPAQWHPSRPGDSAWRPRFTFPSR